MQNVGWVCCTDFMMERTTSPFVLNGIEKLYRMPISVIVAIFRSMSSNGGHIGPSMSVDSIIIALMFWNMQRSGSMTI